MRASLALDHWTHTERRGLGIYTNGDPESAHLVIESLDALVGLVGRILSQDDFRYQKPTAILLFDRQDQFHRFGAESTAGHIVAGDDRFTIALSLDSSGGLLWDSVGVFQHELVHLLLRSDAGALYPPWFDEGFAEFLGATVIRSDIASVGGIAGNRIRLLAEVDSLPLERILGSETTYQSNPEEQGRFYADAWAFVHYGMFSHGMGGPRRTAQFLSFASATGHGAPWREALEASFEASLEEIEAEYERHRGLLAEAKLLPQAHFQISDPDRAADFAAVASADMATLLGEYALQIRDDPLATDLFAVALASDPASTEALLGGVRAAARSEDLARADELWSRLPAGLDAEPASWQARADLDLARCKVESRDDPDSVRREFLVQSREGYERVLARSPERQEALIGVAETYLLEADGADVSRGVRALQRVVAATPRNPHVRLKLARLLLKAGEAGQATMQLDWIIGAYPETEPASEAEALLRDAESD